MTKTPTDAGAEVTERILSSVHRQNHCCDVSCGKPICRFQTAMDGEWVHITDLRAALVAALAGGDRPVIRLPNPYNGDYYCDGMLDIERVTDAIEAAGYPYHIEGQPKGPAMDATREGGL